jgi:hypothetical protein
VGTLFLAVALVICARWFFRSDLHEAVGEALRAKHGGGMDPSLVERLEELADRMDMEMGELRNEVMELGERVEFAERLLTNVRQREGLPGAPPSE